MVHRIQNRNPGYSDFSNQSFSFSNQSSSIITDGANALKIEEELKTDTESETGSAIKNSEEVNSSPKIEEGTSSVENGLSKISDHSVETEKDNASPSNGLENFYFDEETPELFNSETETSEEFTSFEKSENSNDEDDLDIPAFLRRQKN